MNKNLPATTGLSLERLKNFCLVAECGSISKAAQDDTNRQSLFSRQIKELESFFGTELFKRKGRTISLTGNGERLLRITKEFYSSLEDFAECCALDEREIQIGAGDSFIQWLLLPKLPEMRKATEQAHFIMQNLRTDEIVTKLLQGDLHYGILRKEAAHPDFNYIDLGKLRFVLFAPVTPEVQSDDIAQLLSSLQLAGMEGEGRYNRCIDELSRELGVLLKFAVRCSSYPMMCKALKTLKIAGILPEIARAELGNPAFEVYDFDRLRQLDQDLLFCWNGKRARLNENLDKDAEAITETLIRK